MDKTNTESRGVLAAAYRGGRASLRALLTHSVETGADVALCGQGNLADPDEHFAAPPTCPRCLARLARKA